MGGIDLIALCPIDQAHCIMKEMFVCVNAVKIIASWL